MKSYAKQTSFFESLNHTRNRTDGAVFVTRSNILSTTVISTTQLNIWVVHDHKTDRHATMQIFTAFQRLGRPYNRPTEVFAAIAESL